MTSMLGAYDRLLSSRASSIGTVESALRTLSWILPGRFKDADLASEALYAALNVLGLYHDAVLVRVLFSLPRSQRPRAPSTHARYTRALTLLKLASLSNAARGASKDKASNASKAKDKEDDTAPLGSYKTLATLHAVLRATALLIEMSTRRLKGRSDKTQRDAVLSLECLMALLKLGMLRANGGRLLVEPLLPEREIEPSDLEHQQQASVDGQDKADEGKAPWQKRTRPTLASLRASTPPQSQAGPFGALQGRDAASEYLNSRALSAEDARQAQDLVRPLGEWGRRAQLAEVVRTLRPVIYVLAMRKFGHKHPAPWLLSLALEFFAHHELSVATSDSSLTSVESGELDRRGRAFWWYALRGPAWEHFTKPQLEGIASKLADVPLLGAVSTLVRDYIPLFDTYYFYSS